MTDCVAAIATRHNDGIGRLVGRGIDGYPVAVQESEVGVLERRPSGEVRGCACCVILDTAPCSDFVQASSTARVRSSETPGGFRCHRSGSRV